ncbi:Ig-like domain-containing protein [Vibrio ponticus]|nr:hypothetical protein [Vibrio ponticus]
MTVTDLAGNAGSVNGTTQVDITAPGEGVDGDSDLANYTNSIAFADELINEQELRAVDLSGKVEANSTLESIIISGKDIDGNDKSYTLTAGDYTLVNGVVTITDLDLAAKGFGDGQLTVDMTVTDLAGNTGSVNGTTQVDITEPGEGVDGDSDPANDTNSIAFADDLINEQELRAVDLSGKVEANGTLESIIISGKDTDGNDNSYTLQDGDYTLVNGVVTITDLDLAAEGFGDGQLTVDMKVTDLAGNTGSVNDATVVDITAPGEGVDGDSDLANDTNSIAFADDLINEQELRAVDLSGKVEANSTLESIIISGKDIDGNDKSYTLTAGDYTLDNGVVTITDLDLAAKGFGDGQLTVDMTVTDLAGNTGSVNGTTQVDITAPGEGVAAANNVIQFDDKLLNEQELESVDLWGQVEPGAVIGTIIISGTDTNGEPIDYVVPAYERDGDAISINALDLKAQGFGDGELKVTMDVTDSAGNTGTVDDSATVDITAPGDGEGLQGTNLGPVVDIKDDTNHDDLISKDELGDDQVQVEVSVNHNELTNGGHVTLTVSGGDEVQLKLVDGKLVTLTDEATSYQYNNGTITWTETAPAEGGTITVTATQTDKAGNESAQGSDSAQLDTVAPGDGAGENNNDIGPEVKIISDSDNDGWLNESEVGNADSVNVQVEVNHDELANGGYVTLTINGQDVELKLNDADDALVLGSGDAQTTYSYDKTTGTITWTETKPAEGETITVSATQTDQAGNASAEGRDSATVDTIAVGDGEGINNADLGPNVEITSDSDNDGWLNESEVGSADSVNVQVEVNHDELANGGYVTLTINGQDVELKLNDAKDRLVLGNGEAQATYSYDKTTGTITWTETKPAEGETITVTATQTDQAENTSVEGQDSATVDTIAVGEINPDLAPKVEISSDTNNDGWLNESEVGSADSVNVQVEVNHAELANGGYVTLTINGEQIELKLNEGDDVLVLGNGEAQATYSYDKTTGTITWTETKPAEGETITVTATQTDQADNTSAEGQDSATVDTTAVGDGEGINNADLGPNVEITSDSDNDGWLNESEVGSADTVNVKVEVNHDELANGGYVTLTINGQDVELKLNDAKDGLVLGNGDAQTTYSYDKITGTITWTETKPAEGETIIVTATQTDQAGNASAQGQDSATVDTIAVGEINPDLAPKVEISSDTNNDGWLNESEVGSADSVNVQVEVNHDELANGGHVTLTINGEQVELKLNDAKDGLVLNNGEAQTTYSYDKTTGTITWTETKPAEGETITVTATQTDQAGNVSAETEDSATVDTTAIGDGEGNNGSDLGPKVLISSDTNNDGWLNESEVGSADSVNVQVEVNHDELANGGYVTLTVNGETVELKLNDADDALVLGNGNAQTTYSYDKTTGTITWTETKPAEDKTITVTATQTDQAGNVSAETEDSATVDTIAVGEVNPDLAPKVEISSDTNNDGWLNESEVGSADSVNVQVEVNHDELANGGHVTLTINGETVELKLNEDDDALVLANGNAQATYSYDKTTGTITWTETKPAEGETITVTATQTDQADNTSAEGQDSATVDTTAVGDGEGINNADLGPNVEITSDSDNDGWLNESEVGSADSVNVQVEVNHDELANGGHVTLTINGETVELKLNEDDDALVLANGNAQATYSYDKTTGTITWTETKPAEGETITVTATQTDQADNTSAEGQDSATVDTIAVGEINPDLAPKVEISSDTNNDGWLNESEVGSADSVNVQVEVNRDELANGGYVTLTINGEQVELKLNDAQDGLVLGNGNAQTTYSYDKTTGTITWTETKPAEGETITVTATQTDQAGNASAQGQDSATVDTTAIGESEGNNGNDLGPKVLISSDTNNDGWLNESEVGSADSVNVQVEVNHAELANGGYVTLIINGEQVDLKLNDAKDGLVLNNGEAQATYSYDKTTGTITWTETKPAEGETITVTATQTDQAGNVSAETEDSATVDTTAIGEGEGNNGSDLGPKVLISSDTDNDGWLNENEVGNADTVNVKVEVNHDELANGGYVTLTVNGDDEVQLKLNDAKDGLVLGNGNAQTTYSYDKTTGTITWTETKPAEGETITVTATQTDQADNISVEGQDSATVDTTAIGEGEGNNDSDLGPKVLISSDTNNDGWLNENEVGSADSVNVQVEVNHDELANGGYVTLTINGQDVELKLNDAKDGLVLGNGNAQTTYNYDKTTGTITWTETKPAEGETITVTATQTDQADNTSAEGQDSATVDTTAVGDGEGINNADLGPKVEITSDSDNDGWLSESEVGSADSVNVQVEVNHAELANGGYVSLTVNGGDEVKLKLNDAQDGLVFGNDESQTTYSYDKATGTITWTETKPAEGETITVTATQTDQADNTSAQGQDSATVDTTAIGEGEGNNGSDLGPKVLISSDMNNDGWLNESEVGSVDSVNVQVEVNHNELANGGYVTLTINGQDVELKLNDAKEGLVLGNGNAQATYSYDKTTGTITWTETKPAEGETITVTATQTDQAGNASAQGQDSATVDTTAVGEGEGNNDSDLGPKVLISSDTNNDGWLNESEVGSVDSVNVQVEVNHNELANGGYVTLTINGQEVELKLNDAKDGLVLGNGNAQATYSYDKTTGTITWTETKPAEGETITVTATQIDQADNTSVEGQDSATVDITAIGDGEGNNGSDLGPKVLISSDTNNDGWLNESEVGSADSVNVQVEVNHDELANGGYVTLTINGEKVELKLNEADDALVLANGNAQATYSYDKTTGTITWTETKPAEGETITVTATQTDQADNASAEGQDSATVGTPNNPPQAVDDGLANYTVSLGSFNGGSWTDESINITASYNGVAKDVVEKNDALGVHTFGDSISGGPETQIEYNRASGESEKLKIELGSPITSFSFTVSNLYKDEGVTGNHEQGKWVAYLGTTAVASGMFVANDGNRDGSYSISEDDLGGVAFDSIVFEATDYSVKPVDERGTDSSEYYLSGFEGKGSASLVATQNEEFKIKLSQLLDNDSDIDGDSIRITKISESGVNAEVYIKDGYVHFTSSDLGTNTFKYTITDDKGGESEATVTVHVNPPIEAAQISQVTVYEPEVTEGDDLVFLVKLDQGVLGEAGKFDFSYGGINDTASSTDVDLSRVQFTNGVKFENGQLVVPIGVSSFSIVIPTLKDQLAEDTETYSITLNGQEVTGQIINLPPPSAESKEIVGQEDTAIILTLGDFGVRDVNARVEIDWSTVTLGQLQIKNDDEWEILDGDSISAARIKAGDIRYMPENDDSGGNDYTAAGVGDQKNSYQEIKFEVVKDGLSSGEHTLSVDINPLADAVTVDIQLGAITQSHDKFKTWGMVYEDFLPENFDFEKFNIDAKIFDTTDGNENTIFGKQGVSNDYIAAIHGGNDSLSGNHYHSPSSDDDDVLVGNLNDKNDLRGGWGSDILVAGNAADSLFGRGNYTVNGDNNFDIAVLQGSLSDYIKQEYKISGVDDRVLLLRRADHDTDMTLRNIDYIQFDDGIYFIDYINGSLVVERPTWTIAIETIKVNVTDTDGSEQLKGTIDLTGVPDGVELFINGVEQTTFVLDNGIKTYTLDLTLADPFSGEITGAELKVPSSYQGELDFDLSVTATSQEVANGSEQSSTSIANVTVGSDIGEKLTGSSEDDLLSAQAGNDELEGGAGKDTLIGGLGNDILIGGDDQDVFKFVDQGDGIRDGETDTIKDFIRGEDILDFSEVLENSSDSIDALLAVLPSDDGKDLKVTITDSDEQHVIVLENAADQFRDPVGGALVDSASILHELQNLPD